MEKLIFGVIIVVMVGILGLLGAAMVVDYHNFSKLHDTIPGSELEKDICLNDWYKNDSLRNMPVRCVKYYQ